MLHHDLLVRLCQTRDWLRADEEPRPSVAMVAKRGGIATHHFIRLFNAVFGETPHQYRVRAQIERAKHLLVLTDTTVTDICMAVGFSSLGSFSTRFTKLTGMSPTAFRRRHQLGAGPPSRLPPALVPGCFSLMGAVPQEKAILEKPRTRR